MKICLVCSHGGHLTEINELAEAFEGHEIFYITYISRRTERLERAHLVENFSERPWLIGVALLKIFKAIVAERPNVIVSTGAEIALPVFAIAKTVGAETIFVETCTRIHRPSKTGRLIYYFSDHFFVQWKELLDSYGSRARYAGGLL